MITAQYKFIRSFNGKTIQVMYCNTIKDCVYWLNYGLSIGEIIKDSISVRKDGKDITETMVKRLKKQKV